VLQMHDYHRLLRETGVITHEWGHLQNCGFGVWAGGTRNSGAYIVRTNNYNEFDNFFQADPIRADVRVHTIVLVPFEESQKRAEREFEAVTKKLNSD